MAATAVAAPPSLGFENLGIETSIDALELEGTLPPWLAGSLLRTGPARWDLGAQSVEHWFDGLAMLHRFTFGGGRVAYANRFLRSRAFAAAEATGRVGLREFATDPCRSAFRRVASLFDPAADLSDNGAVTVMRLGERWLALTETPLPVAFDPHTLETLGVEPGPPGHHTTAHPHDDGGRLWGHAVHFGARSQYRVYEQTPDGSRIVARKPVRRPAYHHSFGLTPTRAILAEGAFVADPLRLARGKSTFAESFEWRPELGSRFLAFDRRTGLDAGTWETEPFFCFHHVNAFEDGDDLVVDLCAYDDASVVGLLALGRLRAGGSVPVPELRRYRLRHGRHEAEREHVAEVRLELPVTDYGRVNGKRYRHVWGVRTSPGATWIDEVVGADLATGEVRSWSEPGCYPAEPVIATRPGATEEGDGVLLTVVLEPRRAASSLVVLDARTLEEVARARVPHHVPFGFHGAWTEEVR